MERNRETHRTQQENIMLKVKITTIGNGLGIILPKKALAKLKAYEGNQLCTPKASRSRTRITATH